MLECVGGPRDGEAVVDYGPEFLVFLRPELRFRALTDAALAEKPELGVEHVGVYTKVRDRDTAQLYYVWQGER